MLLVFLTIAGPASMAPELLAQLGSVRRDVSTLTQQISSRLAKCELEDFELDKAADYSQASKWV